MRPRVRAPYVAQRLCVTLRTVQEMAARGAIPGAARIGKFWTFDAVKLELFIEEREAETCQTSGISIGGAGSGGCEPPLEASKSDRAYALAMSKLLGSSATRALKPSRRLAGMGRRKSAGKTPSRLGPTTPPAR